MTAPELSTIWPDNLAAWLNTIEAILQMAITRIILEMRMSVRTVAAALITSFAHIATELFVPFNLVGIQDGAYLSLGVFFDGLHFRARLGAQLSNMPAAFFQDLIDLIALVLVQPQIVVDPVHIPLQLGRTAAIVGQIGRAACNTRLIKIDDEHAGNHPD